jgi:hypothetical protein
MPLQKDEYRPHAHNRIMGTSILYRYYDVVCDLCFLFIRINIRRRTVSGSRVIVVDVGQVLSDPIMFTENVSGRNVFPSTSTSSSVYKYIYIYLCMHVLFSKRPSRIAAEGYRIRR